MRGKPFPVWGSHNRNAVNNLLSIPNILFNFLINPAANWGPLSEMMLSSSLCSFYTLSLNNLANLSADVFSVVDIKWTILVNQSTTTRMLLYPYAKGNLAIKSTDICVYGFSGIEFGINFSAGCCHKLYSDHNSRDT